jgi:hypothetical protein
MALAPWLILRTSPWLIGPNLMAIVVLFVLAASPRAQTLQTFPALGRRALDVGSATLDAPLQMIAAAATLAPTDAKQQLRRSIKGLAIATAIGAVLVGLLASADPFFASLIDGPSLGNRLFDMVTIAAGAVWWFSLVIVGHRHEDGAIPVASTRWKWATRDAGLVLGVVAAVLGVYVSSLIAGAIGGARYIQRRTGMTYADYARSGFFQLVLVVLIVGIVLTSCRTVIASAVRRGVLLTMALLIAALTLVMVSVSIARLVTYCRVFGLTMLRVSTMVFAAWLGVIVILIAISLISRRCQPWLVSAVVVSAFVTLAAMNVANPEAIVARENLSRIDWQSGSLLSQEGARFDGLYLGAGLSDDAVPTIVGLLDELPASQRLALIQQLCHEPRTDAGWSWNNSRANADDLLEEIC